MSENNEGDRREPYTDFGYERVSLGEKRERVRGVFDTVAEQYDVMNDLMSFGLHRLWKRFTVELAAARPGQQVLDLAGGTGDLAAQLAPRVGREGGVTLADINAEMLRRGRTRLIDQGLTGNLRYVQADAESLPFADNSFECVCIGFGLRNVTDKARALAEMHRVLRPGGRALVLEFSKPRLPGLTPLYDWYSFNVLPTLGRMVAGSADSYRYLAESIRVHPDQEDLKKMMEQAGLERCQYFNLAGGIVAVHRGFRL